MTCAYCTTPIALGRAYRRYQGAPHHQGCFWERYRNDAAVRTNPPAVLYVREEDE